MSNGPAVPHDPTVTVEARSPWLGLASFTEETREYFYGRDEEVAELARRVQRKLLTVLFGQSGLGKTSILRAGLVPKLRTQGYCPVYVRIDYSRGAPEPKEQIKRAVQDGARDSGRWTRAGTAVEGESLWEYFHHRDDVLEDESGARLIPLLIFDQFEELFTLAQSDDFGRARAANFIRGLADLVENRPPTELETRLEANEAAAEAYDFARGDYRVLIALREDYLAPLEGLKTSMPSITQNRLRLAPMTGQQALDAVLRPGGKLVTEEVAGAIVRFVAGGAEIANAEVEPSLLSLICRELNDARIAQGRPEISLDLVAGSHQSILSEFYERSLADQPPAVRRVIEDELLTDSGFRENVAEESMLERFAAAGAAPGALQLLVNRRLLRVEERLDLRRVELTHDVLCGVVKASRDLRHEREVRDATEAQLREQRERELEARRALARARRIVAMCVLLTVIAVAAAVFGYVSTQRARRAEQQAQSARAAAEHARGEAEHLLGYLTDDLTLELEGVGRVQVVADLAKQEVDYYQSLPEELQSADTRRNQALALGQYAAALRAASHSDTAEQVVERAIAMLDELRKAGDRSETTAVGLGLALMTKAAVTHTLGGTDFKGPAERAVEVIGPYAEAAGASVATHRAYGRILLRAGWLEYRYREVDRGIATLQKGRAALVAAGALDLSDLPAAASYSEISAWLGEALGFAGRGAEAEKAFAEGDAVAKKILAVRPGHMGALRAGALAEANLGEMLVDEMRLGEAVTALRGAEVYGIQFAQLDPANFLTWNNLGEDQLTIGQALADSGHPRAALEPMQRGMMSYARGDPTNFYIIWDTLEMSRKLTGLEAELGDLPALGATLATLDKVHELGEKTAGFGRFISGCDWTFLHANSALIKGDFGAAKKIAQAFSIDPSMDESNDEQREFRGYCRHLLLGVIGSAEYGAGHDAAAEAALRSAVDIPAEAMTRDADRRDIGEISALLALALIRDNKPSEAQAVIAPVVKLQRGLFARNHDDYRQHVELASVLYASALAGGGDRRALLAEASALVAGLPAEMRSLKSVVLWRERIRAAVAAGGGAAGTG
jgi:hypothetical protein